MKKIFFVVAILLFVCSMSISAFAASGPDTWTTGAGDSTGNFSGATNWTGTNAPPATTGDSLIFGATTGVKSLNQNIASLSVTGITFNPGAATYTIGGLDSIALTGSITNNSASNQTITTGLTGGAITIAGSGGMTFSGSTINNTGTLSYTDTGVTSISSNIGSNVSGISQSAGTLTLSGTNTYTGITAVSGAATALIIDSSSALSGSGVTVGTGAALQLEGNISTPAGVGITSLIGTGATGSNGALENLSGTNTYAGAITLGGAATIQADTGSSLTLSGNIGNAGNLLTVSDVGTGQTTISGAISGVGGITTGGTGTLTLGGTNLYTGATTIVSGSTLALSATGSIATSSGVADAGAFTTSTTAETIKALTGAGTASLGSTLTIGDSSNFSSNYTGAASGVGGITTGGTGTLTLGGTNLYTGATTIVSGSTLALSATGSIATSSGVADAGAFTTSTTAETIKALTGAGTASLGSTLTIGDSSNFSSNYTGAASGVGGITTGGTGTLTLGGTNLYTGATTIVSGSTLALSATGSIATSSGVADAGAFTTSTTAETIKALTGAGTASLGSTLTIGDSSNFSSNYTGAASGVGGITTGGTGTLILTGANLYSGATTISAGTLQLGNGSTTGSLSTSSAITDNATLSFDRSNTVTQGTDFATVIGGTGGVTQAGSGTLILSGTNTYSGATNITAGTLQVSNASALGTGAGGVTVATAGTLALGTTNLNIGSGAYAQNGSAALDLTVTSPYSPTGYASITTTGSASTASTNIVNATVNAYVPNGAILSVINTGAAVGGTAPATVNTLNDTHVSFTASDSGDNQILTASRSGIGFASLANNANAQAAGNALDNVMNPSSDMTNVLNTLEFLSDAQITSGLNTLGPIVDGGVRDNTDSALNNFVGASIDRAQNVLTAAASGNSNTTGVSAGDNAEPNSLWAKAYGSYLNQGTRDGIQGYNAWNSGTAVGYDRLLEDTLTIGASLGYAYGQVNSDANNGRTSIQSAQSTIYAGYQDASIPYFIDGAGTFAHNWYDGSRNINVGPINSTAKADYDGQQYGAYLDGGYNFNLVNNVTLAPIASIQWDHLAIGSYTEKNAGALDLNVNRQSYNMVESGLGAKLSTQVKYDWGNLTPEVHAKWLYDFVNDDMVMTSSFTGGGGAFTTNGAKMAKNGADVGGKLSFDLKNNISLIAECDAELRDGFYGIFGSATVRYKF